MPYSVPVTNARSAMFDARLGELRRLNGFLDGFCAEAGLEREQCLRLNLVLEELFTNTVRHEHRGDCDAPVWVTLGARPQAVSVTYEDTAPAFNPYAYFGDAPHTTLSARNIGGLEVLLTRPLAATRDYAYIFGRNRIRLALKR